MDDFVLFDCLEIFYQITLSLLPMIHKFATPTAFTNASDFYDYP